MIGEVDCLQVAELSAPRGRCKRNRGFGCSGSSSALRREPTVGLHRAHPLAIFQVLKLSLMLWQVRKTDPRNLAFGEVSRAQSGDKVKQIQIFRVGTLMGALSR
jgi:hypothetical protein